ncbi:MAG: hypothetical protein LBK13_08910 [Spirochaetales bacterium]|nr:hypothetical protein [Spirochaetales bacterium]
MKFYSLSIFLDSKYLEQCKKLFSNQQDIETGEFEITDYKNDKSAVFEVIISQFCILFLPSNDYHKNMDFEIGITSDTIDDWNNFIENIVNDRRIEIETNYSENMNGLYAIIGPRDIHNPFFFIYDGKYSEINNLVKITGEIDEKAYLFYKNDLSKIIPKNIYNKIGLKISKYNESKIKSIELKTSKKINFMDEHSTIRIKQFMDKFEIVFE